jgi:TonB family protein
MTRHKRAGLSALLVGFLVVPIVAAQPQQQDFQDPALRQRMEREVERYYNRLAQGRGARGATDLVAPVFRRRDAGGAWWTDAALVQRLGLTDDQKSKIERTFENHRQTIVSGTALLEKEEAQLARLLAADPLDRNAVLTQIDRVVQARGEVERANAAMTLEMREHLTRAQWAQLQGPATRVRVGANVSAGNLISQTAPVYPEPARAARIEGAVVLEVEISKEGVVESVRLVSGHALLAQAAVDAAKQWRYKPMLLNGEPVAVITTVTVNFPFREGAGQRGAAPVPPPAGGGGRRGPQ